MLQDSGLILIEAGSAEEALTALQTMAVDTLVTDLNLPGASERLARLRRDQTIDFQTNFPCGGSRLHRAASRT